MCFGRIFCLLNVTFLFVSVPAARPGLEMAASHQMAGPKKPKRCGEYFADPGKKEGSCRCSWRMPYPSSACGGETGVAEGTFSLKGVLDPEVCKCRKTKDDACEKYDAIGYAYAFPVKGQCKAFCQHPQPFPSEACGGEAGIYEGTFLLEGMLDPKACKCLGMPGKPDEKYEDLCRKYGAQETEGTNEGRWCFCPVSQLYPSEACGVEQGSFSLKGILNPEACKCLASPVQRQVPVQVAALHYCTAFVKKYMDARYSGEEKVRIRAALKPELCEEILVGTVKNETWLSSAAKLSTHSGAKGLGHLDPLVTQYMHHELLARVCHDECKELVKETKEEMVQMSLLRRRKGGQAVQTCADNVVRKVEAEILGCCGRSCGWNDRTCTSWPFFSRKEKVDWLEECCTEYNVLEGSSRERMCNSVLTRGQAALVSEFDTHAREGTDVDGPYIGQDPPLLWRAKGIKQFRKELMKFKTVPKEKDVVDSDFLEKHPNVREKGLEEHWFEEQKAAEEKGGPSSFAETNQCTSKRLIGMDKCQPNAKRLVLSTCMRKGIWKYSDRPPENPDEFDPSCKMIGTDKAQRVETPDDCIKIPQAVFGDVGTIKRRFFLYDNPAKDKSPTLEEAIPNPILCHVETEKYQCNNEFDRNDLSMDVLGKRGFDELLYWIDEGEVEKRVTEIANDESRVEKELN